MRHKWKYKDMPWSAKCVRCDVRMKIGKARSSKTNPLLTVYPVVFSTDGGKTWSEGDPPKCK